MSARQNFVERADGGPHHAGKVLDDVELAEARARQGRLNRLLERLRIDRLQEPASETAGQLPHGHDLHAVCSAPGGVDTDHVPGQCGVNDDGAACCHFVPPGRQYTSAGSLVAPALFSAANRSLPSRHSDIGFALKKFEIRLALANPSNRTVPGRQEEGLALVRRVIPDLTESPCVGICSS